jgi:hypothetical protein
LYKSPEAIRCKKHGTFAIKFKSQKKYNSQRGVVGIREETGNEAFVAWRHQK